MVRGDRQRRSHEVRGLAQRDIGRVADDHIVESDGSLVRDDVCVRRPRRRRGRQPVHARAAQHVDDRLRGHDRPDGADQPLRDVRHHDGAHALVVRGDRQRRSHEVRGLAQRDIGRIADDDLVESDRSHVRDVVLVRRPRGRRGGNRSTPAQFSRSTAACTPTGPTPTLQPIDGGTGYYGQFANTSGMDAPSYFPIAVWGAYNQTQANRDLDAAAGINTYVWVADDSNSWMTSARTVGSSVIQDQDAGRSAVGSETAGWVLDGRDRHAAGEPEWCGGRAEPVERILAGLPSDDGCVTRITARASSSGTRTRRRAVRQRLHAGRVDRHLLVHRARRLLPVRRAATCSAWAGS